ncbi:MAG: hypothetical protein IKC32_00620 [Clostridia bacterium]|nr:hypothetical protein [Clostridia bacterium]
MENGFNYSYNASEREEITRIREKYEPKCETKLDRIKKLDREIGNAGVIESLIVGIIGVLVFGVGMCMGLGAIGGGLILGIIVGIIGTVIMLPAYPIYRACQRSAKNKLLPELIALADEIEREA